MDCRLCGHNEFENFVDLGSSPLSNALLTKEHLGLAEVWHPLHAVTCTKCTLTQLDQVQSPKTIFNEDYPYFSSQSQSFVLHAAGLVSKINHRFKPDSVIEIASNDGYLLQHFEHADVLGVEPSTACANVAVDKGITTAVTFWTKKLADQLAPVDCIIGLNVLAHVPDLNDFIAGVKSALKPDGVAIFEFPYLGDLVRDLQFDTIYHEHFSYFSFGSVSRAFAKHNMHIFDVEHQDVHGGSLRIYVTHMTNHKYNSSCRGNSAVDELMQQESSGMHWTGKVERALFANRVRQYRRNIRRIVSRLEAPIVGYGAAAKGNTMLNYCGITREDVKFIVDSTPAKQGKYAPGSHIPIRPVEALDATYQYSPIWIFPWNWEKEIRSKLPFNRNFIIRDQVVGY